MPVYWVEITLAILVDDLHWETNRRNVILGLSAAFHTTNYDLLLDSLVWTQRYHSAVVSALPGRFQKVVLGDSCSALWSMEAHKVPLCPLCSLAST